MTGHPPLRLELRGSPALTGLTVALHAVAAVILLAVLTPVAGWWAAGVLAMLALVEVRERTALTASRAPASLCLGRDGGFALRLRSGAESGATVAARRYVSRWIVVLTLEFPTRGRRTILVARDMLAPEAFRQLRLWSLWSRLPASAGAVPVLVERTISSDTCL